MKSKAIVHEPMRKLFVDSFTNTMTFGNWLRNQINNANLSNAELARRVGVSATYIGNLVRDFSPNTKKGRGRPSEDVVEQIAKALGADINEARRAAGYAADIPPTPPRNVLEFVRALEALGVSHIEMFGGPDVLAKMTPDDFESILSEVRRAVEREIFKKARE
jgi:transcriptional regulator with XRE-family HTH domain